jgi:hypothetical protein
MNTQEPAAPRAAGPGPVALDFPAPPAAEVSALEIVTLGQQVVGRGYRPGATPHVTPRTLALDRAAAGEAGCPECGCPDVALAPYHKAGSFRYAASCPDCFSEWEG